ncbi:transposase family protein [Cyanobacterium sp. IPPAS B-1200]|uniref:transposase family protein n=1 Tax=Cyanobacterium sp. IPPAS B-1200 TaxID=1562720 RepID=UPI00085282B3|nr:transposase family protein [Cyanobacterium sp. IPPAS B-1200]OEJ78406.1 hypothetical protein A5482_13450 [Cyanobacterium sp. IPPAS B-1200]
MNSQTGQKSYLWKYFENIEDPRTTYLIEHKLVDMVALTILGVICGADSWVEIEEYGKTDLPHSSRKSKNTTKKVIKKMKWNRVN